jgi:SAM-dependent methyltransferase
MTAHDAGFNERWTRHPTPQSSIGSFWLKTGWDPSVFVGKRVLDAGCGCGRYTQIAIECGAAEVVAVDAAPAAVRATGENCPSAHVRQADLMGDLSGLGVFDVVFSLGVLHHTVDTRAAFGNVAKLVRPGGMFAAWVYGRPVVDPVNLLRTYMLHEITRAVPPDVLHEICVRYATRIRDMDAGAWGPLEQVLQVSGSRDDDECISDTFDWHTPQYRWWHTSKELLSWFDACGFDARANSFPVSANGVRRSDA